MSTLKTDWADTTDAPDFDKDQIEINNWTIAAPATLSDAVTRKSSVADVHELMRTLEEVENEHRRRAREISALKRKVWALSGIE